MTVSYNTYFRQDSIVTDKINYDLLKKAMKIQEGLLPCNELLGCLMNSKTTEEIPQAIAKAIAKQHTTASNNVSNGD